MVSVLLEYIDLYNIFSKILPIIIDSFILALCYSLIPTIYYAQNYACMLIGWSMVRQMIERLNANKFLISTRNKECYFNTK